MHVVTPFDVPEAAEVLDLETFAARDFTPERTADLNVYDKVAYHLSDQRRKGQRTLIDSYSAGARERPAGLLQEDGERKPTRQNSSPERAIRMPADHFTTKI